tara:strand:- start:838 stop:2307 length:1470 start_codon:yes stop_codon:yes gene_type:complete
MSTNQNDFVIDNGTGLAVRTDIQDALQALAGNSSGNTEPSVKYAYQWWADTGSTPPVMKLRNSSNDGWITIFELDGTITLEDGTSSAPALSFRDDPNTGIYSSASDTFNIATAGVERMELSSNGAIFNEDGADVDFRIEGDTNANLFYVDAGNNRVGIGTNSPDDTFSVSGNIVCNSGQIRCNDGFVSDTDLILNADENGNGNNAIIFKESDNEKMRISDGGRVSTGAETSPDVSAGGLCLNQGSESANIFSCKSSDIAHGRTAVDETDTWFSLRKVSDNKGGAFIHGYTDQSGGDPALHLAGCIDSQGTTFRAIQLTGSRKNANNAGTSPFQSGYPIVRISNDFDTTVASFTPDGLAFNDDNTAANSLGDYEEGTWTPSATVTTTTAQGRYVKIGSMVYAFFRVTFASTSSGLHAKITSLPFTSSNDTPSTGGVAHGYTNIQTDNIEIIYHIGNNSTTIEMFQGAGNQMTAATVSTKDFRGCAIYQAA